MPAATSSAPACNIRGLAHQKGVPIRLENTLFEGQLDRLGVKLLIAEAEERRQLLAGNDRGRLVRPGGCKRRLQPEQVPDVLAQLPRTEQFPDVGEGVATLQQLSHDLQPGDVGVGIPDHPPLTPGGGQEAAVLVGAHVPHRRARQASQLVDPVLPRCLRPRLIFTLTTVPFLLDTYSRPMA